MHCPDSGMFLAAWNSDQAVYSRKPIARKVDGLQCSSGSEKGKNENLGTQHGIEQNKVMAATMKRRKNADCHLAGDQKIFVS
jgi:hypothetical protein